MNTVFFAIHTEYHLLFALKVLCSFHNMQEDKLVIYRLSPLGTRRLNQDLDFEGTNITYKQIRYPNQRFKDRQLRYDLDEMANQNPDYLYIFIEDQKTFPYLFSKLKKNGTKILLCPDGAGAYSNFRPFKERVLQFVYDNIYLWTNRFPSILPFPSKHYAYRKGIDSVIVENAKAYHNYTKREVIELTSNNYSRSEYQKLCNHIFRYNSENFDIPKGSILWIDQPVEGLEESKQKFLLALHNKYPNKKIYIKPHPLGYPHEMNFYEKQPGFEIVRLNFPVELMLDNLDDVNIFGAYSASLYYNNPQCRYYWVSALFSELPARYYQHIPFDHINVITDFNQIELE